MGDCERVGAASRPLFEGQGNVVGRLIVGTTACSYVADRGSE